MARISNGIITGLNVLTLLTAFLAIGFSLFLHLKLESQCQRVLKTPLLVVGIALLAVSSAGLAGSCCRVSILMWLYLFVLFLLILGLVVFTVFTIVVTNKGVERALSGKGIGRHRLGNYSKWLRKYVVNMENWGKIRSCLVDAKLCGRIKGGKDEEFYKQKLSITQSGCCKPPNYCGFHFHNATFWTMPKTGPLVPDPDCKKWSNVGDQLCFDCESCKAAVLADIKRDWKLMAIINVCIVIFVTIVYSVGCCALRNNRTNGYRRQRQGP